MDQQPRHDKPAADPRASQAGLTARSLAYTPRALRDIEATFEWLSQPGSGERARRRIQHIRVAIDRLMENPCRHPRGDRPGTRQMTIEQHTVIYSVTPDTGRDATAGDVVVLRVHQPRQARR